MKNQKIIALNKSANFNYFIEEIFQAGIELVGTEVKSLRLGNCNIKDSFINIKKNEAFIINMHIANYKQGNIFNLDCRRSRRLLLNKFEINKLNKLVSTKGFSIIPIRVYFKNSFIKIDIALARGKKIFDKRREIAKNDISRELERDFKIKYKE
ncbi:MAG: SsrA-binding protein SmpB [Clostridiales bacterium]|jgi:SsrA-binding protein|nr:SsrA-binding protein SmpB [Clostridiales bacterium]